MNSTAVNSTSTGFRAALLQAATEAEMTDATLPPSLPALGRRRRGGQQLVDDQVGCFSLVNVNGVLEWREDLSTESAAQQRGRRRGGSRRAGPQPAPVAAVEVVEQLQFVKLESSQVTKFLNDLDKRLTPNQGLFRVEPNGALNELPAPMHGRTLVLVHGTFSDPRSFVNGLMLRTPNDPKPFLARCHDHYGVDRVYVFGHPTLAESPIENALALAHHFRDSRAEIDVIAHSRGGLVTRWWFEGVWRGGATPGKAMLVGSPLAGTSLAAPPRIRATFKMLTNVANALGGVSGAAATVLPMMTFVTGLMKLIGSFTSLMGNAPVADALVAMVPGLVAQSRVGNQPALLLLRKHFPLTAPPRYLTIAADFEPEPVPLWQFWKNFTFKKGLDVATDVIFDAPNDLVVDTSSMSDFADNFPVPKSDRLELPSGSTIYHTNYFEQPPVIDFLARKLLA
jgi:pimeloyl-ACP methyl ester carboxylesterase